MKLITLLTILAFSYGEKLDRIYLPPNALNSGGSDGALRTPNTGPVGDSGDLQRQVTTSYVTNDDQIEIQRPGITKVVFENAALQRPVGNVESNLQTVNNVIRIGNGGSGFIQNPVDYEGGKYSGQYYQVVEEVPERAQANLERHAAILRQEYHNDGKSYAYAYETENGIYGEEKGVATNGASAHGSYSYVGDDGVHYSIRYTADENGFQPQGDHLPIPPPIPDEILKSLEQNARDEASGIYDDGSYDDRRYGDEDVKQGVAKQQNLGHAVINPAVNNEDGVVVTNPGLLPAFRIPGYPNPIIVDQKSDLASFINGVVQEVTPSTVNKGYLPPNQAVYGDDSSKNGKLEEESRSRQPSYNPNVGYQY